MDTERLQKLLKDFNKEQKSVTDRDSRVLIVDGFNMFIRAFAASPAMSDKGLHVGGTLGFIRSLFSIIKSFRPTRCVLVFDGIDGSKWRRKIYSEYKSGRKNKDRLNRYISDKDVVDERESFEAQLSNLDLILDTLPVTTICIDSVEADDIIGYIVSDYYHNVNTTIQIVSSDRDFYQLISENVSVYSPTMKRVYDLNRLKDEFELTPKNYLTYRVVTGDDVDNINGVKGIKLKTLKKYFPEILINDNVDHGSLIRYAEEQVNNGSKLKTYKRVVESESILDRNYKIMQLEDPFIPSSIRTTVKKIMDYKIPKLNKYDLKLKIHDVGFLNLINYFDDWVYSSLTQLDMYAEAD